MFSALLRAGASVLGIALLSVALAEVLQPLVDIMGHENHWLVQGFENIAVYGIAIGVLAVAIKVVVAGIVEGGIR